MLLENFEAFDNKSWPDSTLILGGKEENLEFERLCHFLNLLDLQLLSQQVWSRVVVTYHYQEDRYIINIKLYHK